MNKVEANGSYFLINAGHPRAVFRPPADLAGRLTWGRWLKGMTAAIACGGTVGLFWASSSTGRPHEATALMEQLASKVEQAKKIHPDTAGEIMRLSSQPWSDCTQVRCSEKLRVRNRAARNRLEMLITKKLLVSDFASARKQGPFFGDADVIATGSTIGSDPK